jgi:hypothetical protein
LVPLLAATSATAGTIDNPRCKRELAAVLATVDEAACMGYRTQFLSLVKGRAVIAACKTRADRDQEVGRLDGNVEDINTLYRPKLQAVAGARFGGQRQWRTNGDSNSSAGC